MSLHTLGCSASEHGWIAGYTDWGRSRLERSLGELFVTLAVEHLARDVEVGPPLSQLLVGLAQSTFEDRVEHLRFVGQLLGEAAADVGDHGAQINQTS